MEYRVIRSIYTRRQYVRVKTWAEILSQGYKYQYLTNDRPVSLFMDFDNVSKARLLRSLKCVPYRIYVAKNSAKNSWHVFCPRKMFPSLYAIKAWVKAQDIDCDLSVYKKEQLFRVPFAGKDGDGGDGIYNRFYEVKDGMFIACEFSEKNFLIHQPH